MTEILECVGCYGVSKEFLEFADGSFKAVMPVCKSSSVFCGIIAEIIAKKRLKSLKDEKALAGVSPRICNCCNLL